MEGGKLQDRKLGSVKAAITSYGQQILEGNPAKKKFQINYPEVNLHQILEHYYFICICSNFYVPHLLSCPLANSDCKRYFSEAMCGNKRASPGKKGG